MTEIVVEPDATAEQIRGYVRDHPDVVKDEYLHEDDPIKGACYVLSEAYFHAQGGTDSGLDIYCLSWSDVDEQYDGTHWFLGDDGTVIDLSLPSASNGSAVPWDIARRRAFITGYEPSARCERVLEAIDT
jgi:uncharacterized membrane protein